jgi:hypothetical protein
LLRLTTAWPNGPMSMQPGPLFAAERTGPGSICLIYVRRAPDLVMRTKTLREQLAAAQSAAFPFVDYPGQFSPYCITSEVR